MNSTTVEKRTEDIMFNYDLSEQCSFKAGGRVFAFTVADSMDRLMEAYDFFTSHQTEMMFLGDGTNILFKQNFTNAAVIKLGRDFKYINLDNSRVVTGAATRLNTVVVKCAKHGLDLSDLAGIPGTMGGALWGNSGDICKFVDSIQYLSKDGQVDSLKLDPASYGYRQFNTDRVLAVLSLELRLPGTDKGEVMEKIRNTIKQKKQTQPVGTKNAGCFFKNPAGYSAGKLIEDAGLKGVRYGDAMVSTKHANFLINQNQATAEDIYVLSRIVSEIVFLKYDIRLENEVKVIGF
ncbi:MAG: UDP-N-acetylmuramate dehydrogenase [Actinomycetia bacterium]|nr:UDP-N-acetylmuramate dehydrogenase [Actinomycetes bacterium]